MVQLLHPCMTTGKTVALILCTFVGEVMSLLFNMLSMFVIAFLPRSKCLLISWLQSPSAVILEKIKSVIVFIVSPSIWHEVMGLNAQILVFWMLSFKSAFSLSSFTFIKSLFSSSPFSAIRVVLSAYLRLLTFLLAILISACASFSPAVQWCTLIILKEMGIPDHLTCLLRNCMQVRKQQLELGVNRLVSNQERSMSRQYIVILLI